MKQGKTPPQVYVLPPRLMKNDINFGEVEFPIFFNFFVKKAFMHPEHKVVIIGDEKTIERVKVLFQVRNPVDLFFLSSFVLEIFSVCSP